MPDMAVQAGPRDDFADDAREDVGDHAPEQEARNDHTEQIKFVFHATSLLCSVSCGSCLGASGKSAQRIPVSPILASLAHAPAPQPTEHMGLANRGKTSEQRIDRRSCAA